MSQTCKFECSKYPDSVEKINWKCVECKKDLKADFDRVIAERIAAAEVKAVEAAKNAPYKLSDEEIAKRRAMHNE